MGLFRKKPKEKPVEKPEEKSEEKPGNDEISVLLLKLSYDIAKNYGQKLKDQFDAEEQSKLQKIEAELLCFFIFSVEHWIQKSSNYSPEKQRLILKSFHDYLASVVNMDTLQLRLDAYGQIVDKEKGDTEIFAGFDRQLTEFCDMPQDHRLLSLAPELYKQALEAITMIESKIPES